MNDVQIECFKAAVETLNFTTASQRVCMSQPSFSRNIAALEEELGLRLFFRSKQNGIHLTSSGLEIYNGIMEISRQFQSVLDKAKQVSRGEIGKLVIGVLNGSSMNSRTISYIRQFRERYPKVEVEIRGCTMTGLEESILKGICDVCFMMSNIIRDREKILSEPMAAMKCFVAAPKSLGLDPEKEYRLIDLKDQTFILAENYTSNEENFRTMCREAGFEPKVKMAPDFETANLWVNLGEGVSGIVKDHYAGDPGCVDFVHVREMGTMNFAIAWSRENFNPVIGLFYSMLEEQSGGEEE